MNCRRNLWLNKANNFTEKKWLIKLLTLGKCLLLVENYFHFWLCNIYLYILTLFLFAFITYEYEYHIYIKFPFHSNNTTFPSSNYHFLCNLKLILKNKSLFDKISEIKWKINFYIYLYSLFYREIHYTKTKILVSSILKRNLYLRYDGIFK